MQLLAHALHEEGPDALLGFGLPGLLRHRAQVADLTPRSITDLDGLTTYCDQVASTVGRTCVRVWGAASEEALEMASQRGIAFQITNILRDIREDHGRGRVYLPADLLAEHGVDVEMILNWTDPQRCTRLVQAVGTGAQEGGTGQPGGGQQQSCPGGGTSQHGRQVVAAM